MVVSRLISILVLLAFFGNCVTPGIIWAQDFNLPQPGAMINLSPSFNPPILKGIKINANNPFKFEFILDQGDSQNPSSPNALIGDPHQEQLKEEANKMIKYFLASLTVPEKDLWVNLSPYEKNRIVPQGFGLTEMGRDLLAQDYMLKQITASLMYPEDATGKKFWKRVYEKAAEKFHTTNIPVSTFNKVWIVPQKAVVFENAKNGTAYIVDSKLRVMLEEDYLSLQKHAGKANGTVIASEAKQSQLGSQILREIVIPQLTKEVNEGKNFAQLRQVFNSLILATWYKKKIKDSILSMVYADKNKVSGVNINDPAEKERIYQKYLQAFKKGVYNYIKDDVDPMTQKTTPRKYFSGGMDMEMTGFVNSAMTVTDKAQPGWLKTLTAATGLLVVGTSVTAALPAAASEPVSFTTAIQIGVTDNIGEWTLPGPGQLTFKGTSPATNISPVFFLDNQNRTAYFLQSTAPLLQGQVPSGSFQVNLLPASTTSLSLNPVSGLVQMATFGLPAGKNVLGTAISAFDGPNNTVFVGQEYQGGIVHQLNTRNYYQIINYNATLASGLQVFSMAPLKVTSANIKGLMSATGAGYIRSELFGPSGKPHHQATVDLTTQPMALPSHKSGLSNWAKAGIAAGVAIGAGVTYEFGTGQWHFNFMAQTPDANQAMAVSDAKKKELETLLTLTYPTDTFSFGTQTQTVTNPDGTQTTSLYDSDLGITFVGTDDSAGELKTVAGPDQSIFEVESIVGGGSTSGATVTLITLAKAYPKGTFSFGTQTKTVTNPDGTTTETLFDADLGVNFVGTTDAQGQLKTVAGPDNSNFEVISIVGGGSTSGATVTLTSLATSPITMTANIELGTTGKLGEWIVTGTSAGVAGEMWEGTSPSTIIQPTFFFDNRGDAYVITSTNPVLNGQVPNGSYAVTLTPVKTDALTTGTNTLTFAGYALPAGQNAYGNAIVQINGPNGTGLVGEETVGGILHELNSPYYFQVITLDAQAASGIQTLTIEQITNPTGGQEQQAGDTFLVNRLFSNGQTPQAPAPNTDMPVIGLVTDYKASLDPSGGHETFTVNGSSFIGQYESGGGIPDIVFSADSNAPSSFNGQPYFVRSYVSTTQKIILDPEDGNAPPTDSVKDTLITNAQGQQQWQINVSGLQLFQDYTGSPYPSNIGLAKDAQGHNYYLSSSTSEVGSLVRAVAITPLQAAEVPQSSQLLVNVTLHSNPTTDDPYGPSLTLADGQLWSYGDLDPTKPLGIIIASPISGGQNHAYRVIPQANGLDSLKLLDSPENPIQFVNPPYEMGNVWTFSVVSIGNSQQTVYTAPVDLEDPRQLPHYGEKIDGTPVYISYSQRNPLGASAEVTPLQPQTDNPLIGNIKIGLQLTLTSSGSSQQNWSDQYGATYVDYQTSPVFSPTEPADILTELTPGTSDVAGYYFVIPNNAGSAITPNADNLEQIKSTPIPVMSTVRQDINGQQEAITYQTAQGQFTGIHLKADPYDAQVIDSKGDIAEAFAVPGPNGTTTMDLIVISEGTSSPEFTGKFIDVNNFYNIGATAGAYPDLGVYSSKDATPGNPTPYYGPTYLGLKLQGGQVPLEVSSFLQDGEHAYLVNPVQGSPNDFDLRELSTQHAIVVSAPKQQSNGLWTSTGSTGNTFTGQGSQGVEATPFVPNPFNNAPQVMRSGKDLYLVDYNSANQKDGTVSLLPITFKDIAFARPEIGENNTTNIIHPHAMENITPKLHGAGLPLDFDQKHHGTWPDGTKAPWDPAQITSKHVNTGGIDLNATLNLELQNAGSEIKLHVDAAMLKQLENVTGFTSTVTYMRPLTNVRAFLGI